MIFNVDICGMDSCVCSIKSLKYFPDSVLLHRLGVWLCENGFKGNHLRWDPGWVCRFLIMCCSVLLPVGFICCPPVHRRCWCSVQPVALCCSVSTVLPPSGLLLGTAAKCNQWTASWLLNKQNEQLPQSLYSLPFCLRSKLPSVCHCVIKLFSINHST